MNRSYRIAALTIAVALCGLLVIPTEILAAKPVILKLSHLDTADVYGGPLHAAATVFKSIVEGKTNGRIKVEIYPNRQLGEDREVVEAVQSGMIEIAFTSDGALGAFVPEIQVLGIPYLFPDSVTAWKVLDTKVGDMLMDTISKKLGVVTLGIGENGFRNFTNSARPIHQPSDLKGLKIRVMEIPAHMKMVEAMGAAAVPMSGGEVYTALQQRVVDGQENPVDVIDMYKYDEVQKYLTLDGHVYSVHVFVMNKRAFDSLSAGDKEIVREAGRAAVIAERGLKQIRQAMSAAALAQRGMQIYTPSKQEIEAFAKASQGPVVQWLKKQIGAKWVDDFMAAVAAVK